VLVGMAWVSSQACKVSSIYMLVTSWHRINCVSANLKSRSGFSDRGVEMEDKR
jgi:hypothetical protein